MDAEGKMKHPLDGEQVGGPGRLKPRAGSAAARYRRVAPMARPRAVRPAAASDIFPALHPRSLVQYSTHCASWARRDGLTCEAFSDGIPMVIRLNQYDHRCGYPPASARSTPRTRVARALFPHDGRRGYRCDSIHSWPPRSLLRLASRPVGRKRTQLNPPLEQPQCGPCSDPTLKSRPPVRW